MLGSFLESHAATVFMYGQTGSGKTYTMFGPPGSMAIAAERVDNDATAASIIEPQHGFILRAGLEALEFVEAQPKKAILEGAMVELSIASLTNQSVSDLLRTLPPFVQKTNTAVYRQEWHPTSF